MFYTNDIRSLPYQKIGVNLLTNFHKLHRFIIVHYFFKCPETVQLTKTELFQLKKYKKRSGGLHYKTFYGRNLQIFIISYNVVPSKPFQPSLVFAGKAGAYPSEARFIVQAPIYFGHFVFLCFSVCLSLLSVFHDEMFGTKHDHLFN